MEPRPFQNPGKVFASFILATIVAVGFGIAFSILAAGVYAIFNKVAGCSAEYSIKAALCFYFACIWLFPYIGQQILYHNELKRIFGPRKNIEVLSLMPEAMNEDKASNLPIRKNSLKPPN